MRTGFAMKKLITTTLLPVSAALILSSCIIETPATNSSTNTHSHTTTDPLTGASATRKTTTTTTSDPWTGSTTTRRTTTTDY